MGAIDKVSTTVNYPLLQVEKGLKSASKPYNAAKKFFQTCMKTAELLKQGNSPIVHAMGGAVQIISFFSSTKDIMYWINPFSKEKIDQGALRKVIHKSLMDQNEFDVDEKVNKIMKRVMEQKQYHSKKQVMNVIKTYMRDELVINDKIVKKIAQGITVKKVSRPFVQKLANVFYTLGDVAESLLVLEKWNVLNVSKCAASIGRRFPVLKFIATASAKQVLGVLFSAGFALTIGYSSYKLIKNAYQLKKCTNDQERAVLKNERRNLVLDLVGASFDLAATLPALLTVVSPPIGLALGIVAKGIGFICVLAHK